MFDSKNFLNVVEKFSDGSLSFVFFDRFTKKFGPLNVANSINEVVYNSCNLLKSVEDKNISLSHIDVYIVGYANVDTCNYEFNTPTFFFNGQNYKEAYEFILEEV